MTTEVLPMNWVSKEYGLDGNYDFDWLVDGSAALAAMASISSTAAALAAHHGRHRRHLHLAVQVYRKNPTLFSDAFARQ